MEYDESHENDLAQRASEADGDTCGRGTKRVEIETFPHPPPGRSHNPPATLENVRHLLDRSGFRPRFNVIKKRLELRYEDGSLASMTEVVSAAVLHGIGTGWLYQFVEQIGAERPYNPIRDWILSKDWDGCDRLTDLMDTVQAADDYPPGLKDILIKKWLLSAVAAVTVTQRFRARGVLTLQGEQGVGKTSWVAALLPPGDFRNDYIKLDHHLDGGNKDSIIGAVTHWITEIGELDSSFKKDIARLKGFLTNDCDKLRRPYARDEVEYPRRTIFAGTVNEETFLVDPTGNSRWWTIGVKGLNFKHQIDLQQLYAQLAVLLKQGEQWWLNPAEERELASYNLRHRSVSAIALRIRDRIDFEKAKAGQGLPKTATEVLFEVGLANPTNAQAKECGSVLREILGSPKRVNGRDKWRVPLLQADQTGRIGSREEDQVY